MRIERLDLIRWGALEGVALELGPPSASSGHPGLHVVYGDNEAGKSTTRRAIGALLFGVPAQTPDGFRFDYKHLRLGATLRLADGSLFSFVRRKGARDTVRDADDRPLDEGPLARVLAGIDREAFEREWSLDHDRLREGGRELLQGKGVLGESLLAAGLGGVGVKALQVQLHEEATRLGPLRQGALKQLLDALRERRAERDAHAVSPRHVEELEARVQERRREREGLEARLVGLGRDLARLDRVQRARPILAERDRLEAELGKLAHVPRVAADFGKRRVSAQQAHDQAEVELAQVQDELARREAAVARTPVDEGLLAAATRIGAAVKGVEAFQGRLEQARAAERDLAQWTLELGQHARGVGLSQDELEALALGPVKTLSERTAELAAEGSKVSTRKAAAEVQLAAAEEARDLAQAEVTRLEAEAPPPPGDEALLRRTLEAVSRPLEGAERDLERLRARARQADETARAELARLAPRWTRGAAELDAAPLPRAEDVEAAGERRTQAARELAAATPVVEAALRERDRVERALERLVAAGEVPTEAALAEARARRAAGWQLLRPLALGREPDVAAVLTYLGEAPAADGRPAEPRPDDVRPADGRPVEPRPAEPRPGLVQAFERAVERADDVSDRLRRESARAARLAQLEEEAAAAQGELEAAKARLARTLAEDQAAQAAWHELFRPCGLEPAEPRVMTRFLEAAEQARSAGRAAAAATRELSEREAEVEALLAQLARDLGRPAPPARQLPALRDEARDLLEQHEAARQAHEEARRELTRARGAVEKQRRELDAALALEAGWTAARAEVARALSLPAAASLREIQTVVSAAAEAATLHRRIATTGPALSALRSQNEAYLEQVARLLGELGRPTNAELPADRDAADPISADLVSADLVSAVGSLARDLQEARTAATQRAAGRARIEELEARRQAAHARREAARAELTRLCAEAGTEDPRALVRVETEDETRRRHEAQLEKTAAELALLAATDLDGLRAEVARVSPDEAAGQRDSLVREQEAVRALLAAKSEEVGAREHELAAVAGGAQAAEDELEIQSLLARLRETSADYLRVAFAARLLRDAAERYRAENQSPMLRRTSELLARLTLGSFSGVAVDEDADEDHGARSAAAAREIKGVRGTPGTPELAGREADLVGRELVAVEGMSDGVRDQLFLALRLAALEHHLTRREPLPFVVDDILIQLSDDRARATLEVLAELGQRTQVLLFTHHSRVAELARAVRGPVAVHRVGRGAGTQARAGS